MMNNSNYEKSKILNKYFNPLQLLQLMHSNKINNYYN